MPTTPPFGHPSFQEGGEFGEAFSVCHSLAKNLMLSGLGVYEMFHFVQHDLAVRSSKYLRLSSFWKEESPQGEVVVENIQF